MLTDEQCIDAVCEPTYPCAKCGELRTKAQGGTVFTVCDDCWATPAKRDPFDQRLADIENAVAKENNAEIEKLKQQLHDMTASFNNQTAEVVRLQARQQDLLQLVARVSQSTPLDSEVAEALEQRGKLLAEIGTLRAQLAASERKLELLDDECHRMVLGADAYRAQLSACRVALGEACDIAERWAPNASSGKYETGSQPSSRERISQLRSVGSK